MLAGTSLARRCMLRWWLRKPLPLLPLLLLRAGCLDVLDDVEGVRKECDWEELMAEVLATIPELPEEYKLA